MGAKLLLRILKGVGGSPPITEQVKELSAASHLHFLGDTEQPLDQDDGDGVSLGHRELSAMSQQN